MSHETVEVVLEFANGSTAFAKKTCGCNGYRYTFEPPENWTPGLRIKAEHAVSYMESASADAR